MTLVARVRRVGTVTPKGCAVNSTAFPSMKARVRATNCYFCKTCKETIIK